MLPSFFLSGYIPAEGAVVGVLIAILLSILLACIGLFYWGRAMHQSESRLTSIGGVITQLAALGIMVLALTFFFRLL
jgi:uncharacterized membrane protein YidH (DUF202 family)